VRSFRGSSSKITVGDRPVEDFPVRMARGSSKRVLAAESRDWMLVRSLLQPGERLRARVAVRFPEQRNAAGHAFLTDQRIMFEYHEKVLSVALVYLVFVGRPPRTAMGDFLIEAIVPDGPGAGRFATSMRIRDIDAFHDFFPTLLDAARAVGAQPEVDANWDDDPAPAPTRAAAPRSTPSAARGDDPSAEAVQRALTALLLPEEDVVAAVGMVHNFGTDRVWVLGTDRRLVVVDGPLIWAALLADVKLVVVGDARTHLRVLAKSLDDWRVLGGRRIAVDPAEERRLVLRVGSDSPGYDLLHDHLARYAGVIESWPHQTGGTATGPAGDSVLGVEEQPEAD
jgi:hypothetical protein